jgi:hypothetical protein
MREMNRVASRLALLVALAIASPIGCVVWPAGSGPGAPEIPLGEALERAGRGEALFIDLRSPAAYAAGHIPGAVNIPEHQIEVRAGEIRKMGRMPILYCG